MPDTHADARVARAGDVSSHEKRSTEALFVEYISQELQKSQRVAKRRD